MWVEGSMYYMGQGQTNLFAAVRGDKMAMGSFVRILDNISSDDYCSISDIFFTPFCKIFAAVDNISTDLEPRAVPVQLLSFLFI